MKVNSNISRDKKEEEKKMVMPMKINLNIEKYRISIVNAHRKANY